MSEQTLNKQKCSRVNKRLPFPNPFTFYHWIQGQCTDTDIFWDQDKSVNAATSSTSLWSHDNESKPSSTMDLKPHNWLLTICTYSSIPRKDLTVLHNKARLPLVNNVAMLFIPTRLFTAIESGFWSAVVVPTATVCPQKALGCGLCRTLPTPQLHITACLCLELAK